MEADMQAVLHHRIKDAEHMVQVALFRALFNSGFLLVLLVILLGAGLFFLTPPAQ
jgi:hypothetical protein